MSNIKLIHGDCMEVMAGYPDNYFDLAIVDPPYGIGLDGQKESINKNPKHNRKYHKKKNWDTSIPSVDYFNALFRVSKDQIIFGGNYFTEYLKPVKGWIFWYKGQNDLTMSDGEMIWTSLKIPTRQIEVNRAALIKQNTFHPTEKPIILYKLILHKYADTSFKILDTHLGSGSSAIAAKEIGVSEFVGIEIDDEYYNAAVKRFNSMTIQNNLF